ncbi:16S rRNA (cytosine(967)-C(5))-methyltransferase RsmB [Bacillus massilinigeriensis]|uniref:16S rRNA (cytosine(967)-C(5))-methyltransferase RsmB n=1 Tax=Bacillus mediterraneensis TaxID=1805474 RepID=UPI0008F88935|nr:16S rRNA (cytosine(967)-C(5))-methyltransferase RsmB [Bacillus mediterraneensis]
MNKQRKNVREAALDMLESVEKNQAYSNLLLNSIISKNQISTKDTGLLTELVYGTLQRKMTLDYYLSPFIKNAKKMQNWVLQLLRLTLYQMLYLDRIPARAAIFEAVEIAKRNGHKGIGGMVNGVLRSIQREGVPSLDSIKDKAERISIETSHPLWLVKRWIDQFGAEKTRELCLINLLPPVQTARVNLTKTTREECMDLLTHENFAVEESPMLPEAIRCLKGNLANSGAFKSGLLTIQDESSMLAAYALGAEKDEQILDACAAPGGKSTHIAEKLEGSGKVISLDLHGHKVKLIAKNAERLGLQNIEPREMDSRKVQMYFEKGTFDRILLDAPCSGLGVLRRKPDMKYSKREEDLDRLQEIQLSLLDSVAPLLKQGGKLVYSTCTIDHRENEDTVLSFLSKHSEYEPDHSLAERMPESTRPFINGFYTHILPQYFGSDGFYIASMNRKADD